MKFLKSNTSNKVTKNRLLIVSPFLYGEMSDSGGGVICFRQLQLLSQSYELAYIGFSETSKPLIESRYIATLENFCVSVSLVNFKFSFVNVIVARIKSFFLSSPELAVLCNSPQMVSEINNNIDQFKPDLIWIQFPQMAQYVEICGDTPCIMDVQDAYTLSGFRQAQRMRGIGKVRALLDWVCWARYEAKHYPQFSAVLTLSEQDATVLHAMNTGIKSQCIGLPLAKGVTTPREPNPMQVGFAGSFGHRPNIEGLAWFLIDIWPLVLARAPTARFMVAGRHAPTELVNHAYEGVAFAGFVPDIFDFYASNTVTVVPLVSGGGVKIKTVEAMLAGSAIVTTQIGAEGTGATQGQEVLIEDEATAFADAVVRILLDASLRENIANAARRHSTENFSADAWLSRVDSILSKVMTSHVITEGHRADL